MSATGLLLNRCQVGVPVVLAVASGTISGREMWADDAGRSLVAWRLPHRAVIDGDRPDRRTRWDTVDEPARSPTPWPTKAASPTPEERSQSSTEENPTPTPANAMASSPGPPSTP